MSKTSFNLDFGTKPSTAHLDKIVVYLDPTMLDDYGKAYLKEARRVNPKRFETIFSDTEKAEADMTRYLQGILAIRLECISPEGCKNWRRAKALQIPAFVQFAISEVGEVIDRTYGLKFIPRMDPEVDTQYDIDWMLDFSDNLAAFKDEGLAAEKDAFPRGNEGDPDVMNYVVVDSYVMGRTDTQTPIGSYVAAFLGFKLKEEITFKMLYRVRYDDVDFIRDMLMHTPSIFGGHSE